MARYVDAGNDLIDVVIGGRPSHDTTQWLHDREAQIFQFSDQNTKLFFEQARSLNNVIDFDLAEQLRRKINTREGQTWSSHEVQPLHTIEQIQTASPMMQRWIMANPVVRERYLGQTLEGYAESYVNMQGNSVGVDQYDYRMVTNGLVHTPDDEDYHFTNYFEDVEGENPLSMMDRIDILSTWDRVNYFLEEGDEDPTSVDGNPI